MSCQSDSTPDPKAKKTQTDSAKSSTCRCQPPPLPICSVCDREFDPAETVCGDCLVDDGLTQYENGYEDGRVEGSYE